MIFLFDGDKSIAYPDGEDVKIDVNELVSSVPLSITFPGGRHIVGNKFFQNFNVIFDYKRQRLHIYPD